MIRFRSPEPVLTPELSQERRGAVANVVFPTAIDRRNDAMLFANVHPAFRALRSQARFVRTVQRLGLRE